MGNEGFQAPAQSSIVQERNKATTDISNVNATTQANDNKSVHHSQTCGGIPVQTPA